MTTQVVKPSELARARAKLYQFLATVYARPPTTNFLRFLACWMVSVSQAEGPLCLLSKQMRHSLDMLSSFFEKMGESSEEELEEAVSVEFTRLFRGVKPLYSPLPPYESVYREEGERVFGELTFAVRQEYRRFGLDLTNGLNGEPPDHISFELEFMHLLCCQEAEAWEKDDEDEAWRFLCAEKEFVTKHLGTWLPKFCGKIREYDRLGLFRGLADLTEGWVAFDYQQHLQGIGPYSSTARITQDSPGIESN